MPISPKLVLLLSVVAAALLLAVGSGTQASLARRPVVVQGYPYASRCPQAGHDDDVVDRWGMYLCNCTSYVAWALRANGERTDWFIRGAMNAWNWPHVARIKHVPVGTRPRAGSVVVWPKMAPPFGHVAYVSGVERDGGIDVAEYNLPQAARGVPYVFDIRRDVKAEDAVFIYVPARHVR